MKSYVFLATGFEEGECIDVCDILTRAGVEVCLVSIEDLPYVTGARGFTLKADQDYSKSNFDDASLLYLPGGMPGAEYLKNFKPLLALLDQKHQKGVPIAAICAAPIVLKAAGLTNDLKLTSHSSVEDEFEPSCYQGGNVVYDKNIFTASGLGAALELGLAIVSKLVSPEKASQISLAIENGPYPKN